MRARFVCGLLTVCSALGCHGPSAPGSASSASSASSESAPRELTIASYNVFYELAQRNDSEDASTWVDGPTLRHVESLDVDVLVMQETNETWEAALRAKLSRRFPHCAFHVSARHRPGGLGVCAKGPIVVDETIESPVDWFPAQRVVVEVAGMPLQLLNVHLRPALSGPGRDGDTWQAANVATRAIRKKEIDAYLGELKAGVRTLIVGDYNELTGGDLFQSLSASGFASALERSGEKASTWRWLERPDELNAQIDHLAFRSTDFELVSARVAPGGNSDHLPIVVKLRLPTAPSTSAPSAAAR